MKINVFKGCDGTTLRIAVIIFVIESIVMLAFPFMHTLSIWQEVLVDSFLLVLLSAPLIFLYVIKHLTTV